MAQTTQTSQFPDLGDWITDAPWKSRIVCLILIPQEQDARPEGAVNVGEKRDLLDAYKVGDTLLVAWGGKWSTTARLASPEDVTAIRSALG